MISIITATYNSSATVRRTIDSVLEQTYHDIEYIVVDGGSIDGTLDIIKEYEPRFDGRLRYISEPDRGIYDALNKGIRMETIPQPCSAPLSFNSVSCNLISLKRKTLINMN